MYRFALPAAALLLSACAHDAVATADTAAPQESAAAAQVEDPYLWLEEVQGERALAQVREWNAETENVLTKDPQYESYRSRARAILDDEQQIAMPAAVMGDMVTNLWRDADNPRGIWRASPVDAYVAGSPQWRTLIDVDALGKEEGKSWAWHGANCLPPAYERCLVSLSPGGTDADVVREFDMKTSRFVEGGFMLPEAKSNVTWIDRDTLIVVSDFGPDSLTDSGYGRFAKIWKRGTPLGEARTVMTGEKNDVAVTPLARQDGDRRWVLLGRSKTFWTNEVSLLTQDGRLVPTPLPEDAEFEDILDGRLIAKLQSPLGRLPEGAVVAYDLAAIEAGRPAAPELVMAPSAKQAIEEVSASENVLWVKALEDVSGKLFALRRRPNGQWSGAAVALPDNSTVQIASVAGKQDMAFATVESMLDPPALYAVKAGEAPKLVQSLPPKFDADLFKVEQRFATSKDGTRIPYFLVMRKGVDGPVPALIHAYGGFRAAQTPTYLTGQPYRAGPLGLFWAEEGNAYVLANIRGGGEYGPEWHRSVLRENRQKAFDDLHAVAEDLVRTGVSAPKKIGISGRSNGGVLVGAAMNQRPDLYGAVISGSPLSDMKRYSQLLAGASWVGEYGDPQKPEDWAFISQYSPYQNLRKGVDYPAPFYYTSTLDDRVHPGHARKMIARLEEYGNRFYYHEHMEGGHAAGVDRAEDATRAALLMAYLKRELGGEGK